MNEMILRTIFKKKEIQMSIGRKELIILIIFIFLCIYSYINWYPLASILLFISLLIYSMFVIEGVYAGRIRISIILGSLVLLFILISVVEKWTIWEIFMSIFGIVLIEVILVVSVNYFYNLFQKVSNPEFFFKRNMYKEDINNQYTSYYKDIKYNNEVKNKNYTDLKTEINYYEEIFNSFDGIFVALLGKVAKADGRIDKDEAKFISDFLTSLSERRKDIPNVRDIYKKIMDNEKDNILNIDILCKKLIDLNTKNELKIELIKRLLDLAFIDSRYDETEENLIVKIVHNLNVSFSVYQNIKKEYEYTYEETHDDEKDNDRYTYNGSKLSLEKSFEILESKQTDTNKVIKDNYKRLMKLYHYDSLRSKDLPKDLLDIAEEKSKMINAAYDVVKKYKEI